MARMEMMDHIVAHSIQVRRVADFLAERLGRAGVSLDTGIISRAALLHDITKTRSFSTGERHAQSGGEWLAGEGYPEVGDIVRQHVVLDTYPPVRPHEAVVVNYADKRVLHDEVVGLPERREYILEKYGETEEIRERIRYFWMRTREMEQWLFSRFDFPPGSLPEKLGPCDMEGEMQPFYAARDRMAGSRPSRDSA